MKSKNILNWEEEQEEKEKEKEKEKNSIRTYIKLLKYYTLKGKKVIFVENEM